MNKIRKAMFYSIIFKHLLLMNDTITLASIIVITRQSFIQSSNAIASIFFSSHAELLSSIPIHSLRSQNITSVWCLGGVVLPVLILAAATGSVCPSVSLSGPVPTSASAVCACTFQPGDRTSFHLAV